MSTLSYPKPRDVLRKFFTIARTDSSTDKMTLPKGAIVTGVFVDQQVASVTGAASYNLGWAGATTALLSSFSLPVSSVGLVPAGAAAGSAVLGSPLTADQVVLGTFTAGTSASGATGIGWVEYIIPGPGETITS